MSHKILTGLLVGLVMLSACANAKPNVVILSPAHGSQFREGETVAVQSTATDATGIARVELLVDGAVVRLDAAPTPQKTFTLIQTWQATGGTHTLMVRAYNTAGAVSEPAAISISVVRGVAIPPTLPPSISPIEATKIAELTAVPRVATPVATRTVPPGDWSIEATKIAQATAFAPSRYPSVGLPTQPLMPTPVVSSQAVCQDAACMADGVRLSYLIVTRPLFVPALTSFINWKTTQGYRVGIVTADWLAQRFVGRHLAERLKIGLHTLRRQTGLHYVLLVGDTEVAIGGFTTGDVLRSYDLQAPWNVPTGFYTRADSRRDDAFPSDMYFVEDKDWDPQNTGRNPMPQQQTGVLAEGSINATLFLGRWPVRRPEEIAPIVAKTRAVAPAQRIFFTSDVTLSRGTPYPDASCLREPLPSASNTRAVCYSDAVGTARLRLFENNAPWLRTESLFVDLNDSAQVDQIFRRLSAVDGVAVGLYHGAYNCWISGRLCPLVKTTDSTVRTFDNFRFAHNFPLLIADGCYIAAFYAGTHDTVFESFLKVSTGPAVIAQAPNNLMFLSALREGRPVGEAFWRSGAYYFIWGNPVHLLGDPSLQVLQGPPTR